MRLIKYIWILFTIYLVCSARTCNEDEEAAAAREEEKVKSLMASIEMTFTAEILSDSLLGAYELTAINKLRDFADYINIISDTTLNLKFRQHAAELIRTMFIPGEIELETWNRHSSAPELNTLELLIDHSISEGISFLDDLVSITVNDQFVCENDSTFTGTLSFSQKYVSIVDSQQVEDLSGPYVIDIYLMRKMKHFGIQQLGVWEVYLGSVKIR